MRVEFDPDKDEENQAKHGVSLLMAVELDWEAALVKAMVPLRSLRGRPKSENKKLLVSVRYSPEVVAYFKSTGDGWQSRMDGVLRQYVAHHSRSA